MNDSRPGGAISLAQDAEKAILMMVLAMLWLPCIDAFAKILSATLSPGEVAWSRFLFQTIFLAPVAIGARRSWRQARLAIHALRGALIALATLLFFSALQSLPLADAIAIFFVEPLILTLLSALFLDEPIGWRRLSAVAVGFLGALLVIRPSYEVFGWAAVLPLGAAVAYATYLLLTRKLALQEAPAVMQLLAGFFGAIVMSVALALGAVAEVSILAPSWPTAREWAMMAAMGFVATSGHLLVVHAFRRAQAAMLAPFQYLEIITATLLGLLIFGDFPDLTTWLGVAVIIASGVYVYYRERGLRLAHQDKRSARRRVR